MEWVLANKEWLLSGIAIAIPLAVIGWWRQSRGNKQVVKNVENSTIVQAHDINIRTDK